MEIIKPEQMPVLDGHIKDLLDAFRSAFGEEATVVARVPGRVNLIGEHIDYCGYGVHPMAIDQDILVAMGKSTSGLKLRNLNTRFFLEELEFKLVK